MKRNLIVSAFCMILSAVMTLQMKGTFSQFAQTVSGSGFCVCAFSFFYPGWMMSAESRTLRKMGISDSKQDPLRKLPQTDMNLLWTGTALIMLGIVLSYLS
ncbi:MAG: hypothetical protein ACI32N_02165 [Bulleidia sp.]